MEQYKHDYTARRDALYHVQRHRNLKNATSVLAFEKKLRKKRGDAFADLFVQYGIAYQDAPLGCIAAMEHFADEALSHKLNWPTLDELRDASMHQLKVMLAAR